MGPEAKLWKALKPNLEAAGCFCTRIENRHGGGIPDLDVFSPQGFFKVELKVSTNFSVLISDIQTAYNTLLACKNGLSFIMAEALDRPRPSKKAQMSDDLGFLFTGAQSGRKVRGPGTESGRAKSGRVGADEVGSGRVGALGPRTSAGSGTGRGLSGRAVGERYHLFHGRDALDVKRSGLRAEALARSDSLIDIVAVMLAVSRAHHLALMEKGPGH